MDRRDARSRVLLITILVSGFLLGVISLSPVAANHNSSHTAKQIKGLKKQVNALKGTVGSLQGSLTTVQGSLTTVQGTVNNLNSLQYMTSASVFVADLGFGQAEAVCPAGTFATGGGGFSNSFDGGEIDSYPSHGVGFPSFLAPQGRTGWTFEWSDFGGDGFPSSIRAYVICLKVSSPSGNYTPGTAARVGAERRP